MEIKSKKFNGRLYRIEPWPTVGVPIGDGWGYSRSQVVRAVRKIRRAGFESAYELIHIAYHPWPCCYAICDSYRIDGTSDEEIARVIDNGGYWAIVCDGEKKEPLINFVNNREGIYCDND